MRNRHSKDAKIGANRFQPSVGGTEGKNDQRGEGRVKGVRCALRAMKTIPNRERIIGDGVERDHQPKIQQNHWKAVKNRD